MHFPLRGGFMLRLMACIHLAGTLGHGLSEKSQFSSFSTRRGVRCVKNARNPQRIPVLFALRSLTPCEKVVHFFVFRNALKTACGQFFLNVLDSKYTTQRTPLKIHQRYIERLELLIRICKTKTMITFLKIDSYFMLIGDTSILMHKIDFVFVFW